MDLNLSRREAALCAVSALAGTAIAGAAFLLLARSSATAANGKGKSGPAPVAATTEAEPSKMRAIYESSPAVAQYLQFHYCPLPAIYAYDQGLTVRQAFGFPTRVAEIAFGPFKPAATRRALDLGCATGVSSFVLSRGFDKVVGVDLSAAFIGAANEMKAKGSVAYEVAVQGAVSESRIARLGDVFDVAAAPIHPERVEFLVGDAETFAHSGGAFDFVLACNLVCRVPHPRKLIANLAALTAKDGVLVVLTPFSWTEESTNRSEWIGGSAAGGGRSEAIFIGLMEAAGFALLQAGDEPHFIPDHARRFQLGFPMRTIWRRK
jgi:SAM-dependent methyltransferase